MSPANEILVVIHKGIRDSQSKNAGTMQKPLRFIDLFAGVGGFRLALESSGMQCVFTSEWDRYAQKTYAANHGSDAVIHGDIREVVVSEIPDHDVLAAGFPCQPFSLAGVSKKNSLGKGHGFLDETQGTLFFNIAEILRVKRPTAFILENVKNLTSHDKGRTFEVIKRVLTEELGYKIKYRVLDASHFVPQHRERIFIVGHIESVDSFDFDKVFLRAPNFRPNLRDVLQDFRPAPGVDGGKYSGPDGNGVDEKYILSDKLWKYLVDYAEKHRLAGNGFGYSLANLDKQTRTLSARYHKDGSEILIPRGEGLNPRRLTPRECARLMGYSDTFKIEVSDTQAYRQFGNSVAVPLVRAVAEELSNSLRFGELP
jgi:DNA (cytosine-5)-methyltransferase 1